jgi:hypothetical protein
MTVPVESRVPICTKGQKRRFTLAVDFVTPGVLRLDRTVFRAA